MKTFDLHRDIDDSGVSGTGKVAEACVFSNGRCVVAWVGADNTGVQSTVVYDSLQDATRIHGHEGNTRFVAIPTIDDALLLLRKRLHDEAEGLLRYELKIPDNPADT